MAKHGDAVIPVFDGEDYSMWKKRIVLFLKLKECDEVVNRAKTTDDKDQWDRNDLKAMNYIYSAISNRQLEFVCEKTTAYDIIKKFDSLYLKESTALQIMCRNKLERLRLKNYSDTATFFSDFEKCVNELKNAGASVSEKEKLNYMLNSLPESYSYIGDLIDTLKEEDQTAEYVKSKIQLAEMKNQKDENFGRKSNAFIVNKHRKDRACYGCGETTHILRDCKNGGQVVRTSSRGTWYSTQGRQGVGRRGNYRGRGGNHRGQAAATAHQASQQQKYEEKERNSAWITEVAHHAVNNTQISNVGYNEIEWILDSGCTDHIINDEKYFENSKILEEPVNVYLGDNRVVKATKIGNVVSYFDAFGKKNLVDMRNVFYVKDMKSNLISYSKITEDNTIVSKGKMTKIIDSYGKVTAVALKNNGLYIMKSRLKSVQFCVNIANKSTSNMGEKEKWHRLLGHVNFKYLNVLSKDQLLKGIPSELGLEFMKCKICIESKMHNIPFENNRGKAKEILEIVHTDVCGPFQTTGFQGENYFISFIDDYSKVAKVCVMKSKTEVYDCLVEYVNECENLTGKKVKFLRCDNGTEYLNSKIYSFAKEKGIVINNCPAYVHELNGTAERFNRTIMNMSRCLLAEANVDKKYWPEIVCAATYLKNRTLSNTVERKTPYEIFFGKRPDVSNLRLYGSKVFVRIPEQKRTSKWDKKADMGILIGYSNVGYRVLLNGRVIVARHVDIVEENVKCIGLNENESENNRNSDNESLENFESSNESMDDSMNDTIRESEPQNEEAYRSKRTKNPPKKFDDYYVYNSSIFVNMCRTDIPNTFEEAIESSESKFWKRAMDKEIDCLNKNKTWKLVENVNNNRVLDVKWVYSRKSDNTYKARLVVRGFQQTDEIDDVYSPVAKMQTLKVLLSFCCQMGLEIEQMDVETAFLNGQVNSEVYVKQPKGYGDETNKVCKLIKALYGLKESPRAWYECLDKFLISIGFVRSNVDFCLYTLRTENDTVYLLIFVDDLLICGTDQSKIKRIKVLLSERFQMKDLGKIKEYLGITVDYDSCIKEMKLNQTKYIEALAKKYNLENSRLYNTPMEVNLKIEKSDNCERNIKYRNLIGALLYISSATRPDISFSVNYLSRFQNCYNETHYKYALRILKYLYLTRNLRLTYKENKNVNVIDCYVDADWAGDNLDRKSTTGYMISLFGNIIYWKSRKQRSVTKASTFAEYVALSEAVSELKFVKELLKTFNVELREPINVYEDNSGVIDIAKNGNFTKNSKHIEVHYHYVHECINEKFINLIKISSDENVADIFTKALCREKFEKLRSMLNLS